MSSWSFVVFIHNTQYLILKITRRAKTQGHRNTACMYACFCVCVRKKGRERKEVGENKFNKKKWEF